MYMFLAHVYVYAYMHTSMQTCMHRCVHACIHTYKHIYIHGLFCVKELGLKDLIPAMYSDAEGEVQGLSRKRPDFLKRLDDARSLAFTQMRKS